MSAKNTFFLIFFSLVSHLGLGQTSSEFKELVVGKEWHPKMYENAKGEKYYYPDEKEQGEITMFHKDATMTGNIIGKYSRWSYNETTKIIETTDLETKIKLYYKIMEVSEDTLVMECTIPKFNDVFILHFVHN